MANRKKVVVSGASSGIGKATAIRFAREGWDVCLNARREAVLRAVRDDMPPGEHLICAGDYSERATAEAIDRAVGDRWGRVDALVNCAGVWIDADAIDDALEDWVASFHMMVQGAVLLTRTLVRWMANGGRIIHVTSIHGERVEMGGSGYAVAKAALNQYSKAMALELADRGILVNAIAPGFVRTAMSVVDGVNELDTDWFRQNYVTGKHLPLRRAGEPEEIAGVAFFLAGPDATYITGQVITVDGGLTITF